MKNIAKMICLILVAVTAFTGCTLKAEDVKESTTNTFETEKESVFETLTEMTTEPVSAGYMNVSNEDLETLRRILCGYHYKNYDSSTATEEDFVNLLTDGDVCMGLLNIAKNLTSFPEEAFSQYAMGNADDPMRIFESSYVWIREDMFDFISETMFGVTFLHEFDETKESNSVYYYYDGYFYFSCMITGLDVEDILINDCVRQEDGRYLISTELVGGSLDMDEEIYHKAYADILAGVAEKDGIRYWKISEIKVF